MQSLYTHLFQTPKTLCVASCVCVYVYMFVRGCVSVLVRVRVRVQVMCLCMCVCVCVSTFMLRPLTSIVPRNHYVTHMHEMICHTYT